MSISKLWLLNFWYENRRKLHRILNCGQINKCLRLRNPCFDIFTWNCMYGSLPLPTSFLSPYSLSHSSLTSIIHVLFLPQLHFFFVLGITVERCQTHRYFTQTLCFSLDPVWDTQLPSWCSHCLSNLRFAVGYFPYLIRYIVIKMMFLKLSKKQRFVFL